MAEPKTRRTSKPGQHRVVRPRRRRSTAVAGHRGLARAGARRPSEATLPLPSAARPIAVIDLGSRALRMAISEVVRGRDTRRLETLSVPVAIGVDTFARGSIRAVTTQAVVKTLGDFKQVLRTYGIALGECRVVATTAVRDARNREVFLDRLESRTGFRVEVLEAIEETRLVQQLVRHLMGPTFDDGCAMVLALGAGGTHMVVQQSGQLLLAETLHFGMLRLRESTAGEKAVIGAARRFLNKVAASIDRVRDLSRVSRLVVLNTELYRLVDAVGRPRRSDQRLTLRRAELERLGRQLDQVTTQQIAQDTELDHAAAELARMALAEACAFCANSGAKQIVLPACSMIDSLLLDTRIRIERAEADDHTPRWPAESAAWAVARRFRIDEPHAAKVLELALQLFDGLQELIGLGSHSRLLLGLAAILHDIGFYVSTHDHAAHSAYLVANSEIMGVSSEELARIALIVRYHRGSMRGVGDIDLGHLPPPDRVELLKLIAVLRLADALDADHCQRVRSVRVNTIEGELQVLAETYGSDRETFLDLERTFGGKAALWQELFGMTPQLSEVLAV